MSNDLIERVRAEAVREFRGGSGECIAVHSDGTRMFLYEVAGALAAQAAEIERLTIECGMYKTAMEQSRKVLEDVEPRMYAAEARADALAARVAELETALQAAVAHNDYLAGRGDGGSWNADQDRAIRAALHPKAHAPADEGEKPTAERPEAPT